MLRCSHRWHGQTKAQKLRTSHMCVMFETGRGSIITLLRQTSKNFSPPPFLSRFPRPPRPRPRPSSIAGGTSDFASGCGALTWQRRMRRRPKPKRTMHGRARARPNANEVGGTDHAGRHGLKSSLSRVARRVASHLCVSRTTYDLSVCPSVRPSVRVRQSVRRW